MTIKADIFPYEGDLLIANAARGTHGTAHDTWSDVARSARSRSDPDLLRDLASASPVPHELPFRHAHVSLRCAAPVPIARQLGKHQVGFEWSETSRRLKTKGFSFHRVAGQWRMALSHYSQGSGDLLPSNVQNFMDELQERNIANGILDYESALNAGVAPEQARLLLPQSMECLWVWTGSLLGWSELYRKRSGPETQKETRDFAEQVAAIMREIHPVGWAALRRTIS